MSISPISTSFAYSYQAQLAGAFMQRGQDFETLGHALQSGDLAAAQEAFVALKKDTQTIQNAQQQTPPSGQGTRVSPNFKMVESALNSGDLSGAQKAFATVQQEIQAVRKSHGSHVHLAPQAPGTQNASENDNDGLEVGNRSAPSIGTHTNQRA
jgi:hypothetical protein